MGGPVRIVSTVGNLPIFASERTVVNHSFHEVLGVPVSDFTTVPARRSQTVGVGNTGGQTLVQHHGHITFGTHHPIHARPGALSRFGTVQHNLRIRLSVS